MPTTTIALVPLEPLHPTAPVGCRPRRARRAARLAAPFLGIRLGFDAQNDPPSYTTHRAYDLLADGFGPGVLRRRWCSPSRAHRATSRVSADAVGNRLREVDGVASSAPPSSTRPVARPCSGWSPPPRPGRGDRGRGRHAPREAVPAATAGTDLTVDVGAWPPRTSTSPVGSRTGCRCSSAACCWSRSCC